LFFLQESVINTPVKDVPLLKENEEKDKLVVSESDIKIITVESETKDENGPLITNENTIDETSVINNEKSSVIKLKTNEDETLKETMIISLNNTVEVENNSQQILDEVENKVEYNSEKYGNQDLELSNEIETNDLKLTNKICDSKPMKENEINISQNTENDEIDVIEKLKDNINNLLTSQIVENKNINLNITEEISILNDVDRNNFPMDNLMTDNYVQINGEISPVNSNDIVEYNVEGKIENFTSSDEKDIEVKSIEMQNNLNKELSDDLKVNNSEENNDIIPLIIDSEYNEDMKEKINGNIANQDSFSNSSDSETIVNSEYLQHEINDNDNIENSEKNTIAQPISVITIQTCDTVDSDCSEAYLTPNELNDTPKKILEKNSVHSNDYISIINENTVSQLNPSIKINDEVEIPSKNKSDTIIEQESKEENIDKLNENENVVKTGEHFNKLEECVDQVEGNTDIIENIEYCKDTEVESKDMNIVLQPQEEHDKHIENGMFYHYKCVYIYL